MTTITPPTVLTSGELTRAAGITFRQLDHWVRAGYLQPHRPDPGSGRPRTYDPPEVAVAKVLAVIAGWLPPSRVVELCTTVRAGTRGRIEFETGVWLDLDTICGDTT